ncbi:MAG TPA: hypothetical protein VFT95_12965, partial [Micromonosporaceae bacterium]|nr:hypothetical protein [Micromonosporaceae bacterium]
MPERNQLDQSLAGSRAALLAGITQPPLERIGERAATIRRRRRAVRGGAAAAVVAVAVLAVIRPGGEPKPQVAQPPERLPVYVGEGITINGLPDLAHAVDLPGTVSDVEFADPEHGYAVSTCEGDQPADCRLSLAGTADGGRTWTFRRFPSGVDPRERPELEVFGPDRLLIRVGALVYASADGGQTWRETVAGEQPASMRDGDVLRPGPGGDGCAGGRVVVWTADRGPRGPLPEQPHLDVCQVVPAAGGSAWWVGGSAYGKAAVAVTRDRGATWQQRTLPLAGSARVAVLGSHVYAVVVDAGDRLGAVFHSADRGATFTRTGAADLPPGLAGDPVALLDGRLLLVGTDGRWWVSKDDGRTFVRITGTLPAVGRLACTRAGYVAHDLFHGGWSAF